MVATWLGKTIAEAFSKRSALIGAWPRVVRCAEEQPTKGGCTMAAGKNSDRAVDVAADVARVVVPWAIRVIFGSK